MRNEELAQRSNGALAAFEGATVTATSLTLLDDVTDERVLEIAGLVGRVSRAGGWWVGDLVNAAELRDENLATNVADTTGWGTGTILSWSKICRTIAAEDRNEHVSISAHFELLHLYEADREAYAREMRELDEYRAQYGKNLGHRDLRAKLRERYGQAQLTGLDWRPAEERLVDAEAERDAARTALEDLQLRTGLAVRCPRCRAVHPRELMLIGPRT